MNEINSLQSFEQAIKRLEATDDYHKAYTLCLANLTNAQCAEAAAECARKLANQRNCLIFENKGNNYVIKTNQVIDENFLLDIAIELGYKNIQRSTLSKGFLSGSVPCLVLSGEFFSKHYYGWETNKNKQTSTIYYRRNWACDDFKMITAISEKLIEMYS